MVDEEDDAMDSFWDTVDSLKLQPFSWKETEDADITYISSSSSLSSFLSSSQNDGCLSDSPGTSNLHVESIEDLEEFQKGNKCTSSQPEITKDLFSFHNTENIKNIKKGFVITSPHHHKKIGNLDFGYNTKKYYFSGSPSKGRPEQISPTCDVPRRNGYAMELFEEEVTLSTFKWKTESNLVLADKNNSYIEKKSNESINSEMFERSLCVQMYISPLEIRFGFFVIGGVDEGIRPMIDHVTEDVVNIIKYPVLGDCAPRIFLCHNFDGSSADRADLEVGDEIIEVNGLSLENFSHADIISYIHKCIKAKTICLRVKRKKKHTVFLPENIQNAFIIAVEDEARERLEKLSDLNKVVPLDMTKVEQDNAINSERISDSVKIENTMPFNTKGSHVSNGHVELKDMNGYVEKVSPKKGKGKRHHKSSTNVDTPLIESVATNDQLMSKVKVNSQNSLNGSQDTITNVDDSFSDATNHNSIDIEDNGPHREMAVDCPDNFVGTVKTPPRFPPPQSTHPSPRFKPGTPTKGINLFVDKHRLDSTPTTTLMENSHQLTSDQLERLHKHEDELRKRKVEVNRIAAEQDFLRTSLRNSRKLQTLENKKHPKGVVNDAFIENVESSSQDIPKARYMKKNIGLEDLFSSLCHLQSKLSLAGDKEKLVFLQNLFQSSHFQQAVRINQAVIEVTSRSPPPLPTCTNAEELVQEVIVATQQSPLANDLVNVFLQDNFKSLLQAHDFIAEQKVQPVVGPQDLDGDFLEYSISQYGEGSVKIVHLEKTTEPLGATIRNEEESVLIGRIVEGGIAEKSGLFHEGDEILEVNGIDMRGKNINDVSDLLANMTGHVTFMIIPSTRTKQEDKLHHKSMNLKAMFDYDPEDDMYIPCRELGISFIKGDILHVINQEDPNWWQALREGEEEQQTLAGLIPSKSFHEQRESMRQTLSDGGTVNPQKMRACACGKKGKKKSKMYNGNDEQATTCSVPTNNISTILSMLTSIQSSIAKLSQAVDFVEYKDNVPRIPVVPPQVQTIVFSPVLQNDADEILTYEEVAMYYPQPNKKRPIVLIGPPNIGRHELRQKLMESDCDRFAAAIPHTSRQREAWEVEGKDFYFLSRSMFEAEMIAGKFFEHGHYEKHLFGTTLDAVRQVVNQGKICILVVEPEALRELRYSDLKPYVVFVYPPNIEKLKHIKPSLGLLKATDDELKVIITKARELEDKYGHYFDYILVNGDLDKAYDELLLEINRLELEPQWVPAQ